jgi:hypothetical protein
MSRCGSEGAGEECEFFEVTGERAVNSAGGICSVI